jgi:hypothetical protein
VRAIVPQSLSGRAPALLLGRLVVHHLLPLFNYPSVPSLVLLLTFSIFATLLALMASQFVQPNKYYLFSSDLLGSNYALAETDNGPFFVTPPSSQSSNNWQLFYQDPVFLIRNHDSLETTQLGLTEENPTVPTMLASSGDLKQQYVSLGFLLTFAGV